MVSEVFLGLCLHGGFTLVLLCSLIFAFEQLRKCCLTSLGMTRKISGIRGRRSRSPSEMLRGVFLLTRYFSVFFSCRDAAWCTSLIEMLLDVDVETLSFPPQTLSALQITSTIANLTECSWRDRISSAPITSDSRHLEHGCGPSVFPPSCPSRRVPRLVGHRQLHADTDVPAGRH